MRDAFCKESAYHKKFDRKHSKCSCGAALLATCSTCSAAIAYGYVAEHEKKCRGKKKKQRLADEEEVEEAREKRVVRFAYLASDWKLNPNMKSKDAFLVPPRGQLWDGLPEGFPEKEGSVTLRVHKAKEQSMRDMEWMDAYDVLFARIACDQDQFELVEVFHSWSKLKKAILTEWDGEEEIDLLVMGNWIMKVVEDGENPHEWLERLRWFELKRKCRIFPPLDYAMHFSRKELYYHELSRVLRVNHGPNIETIPTLLVEPGAKDWKERVRAFAREVSADTVVFKRSMSECKKHVVVQKVKYLRVPFEDEGDVGAGWLVQPFVKDFEERNELRLYVLDGVFAFGVESCFGADDDAGLRLFAFDENEGPQQRAAVKAAESVARAITMHQPYAGRFLRVDMIWSESSECWMVNELEFFGNAYLHTEVLDDSYEVFPVLVDAIKRWMLTM